jgi:hypothetical protein
MSIVANPINSEDLLEIGGKFMALALIVLLSISYIVSKKYPDKFIDYKPLLLMFILVVMFKINSLLG